MPDWTTACPDWADRIVAKRSLIPAIPLDEARAAKALRIFKRLRMVDVPGHPTMGQACEPWVFEFVRVIFGAADPATKRQFIQEFFLLVSKKNGKSSIAAGIMLTALIMNERTNGEYLILAPTKDVADNSFTPAYGMVKADKALIARYKPSDTTREIVDRLDGSTLAVKAADADVVGGQKAIAVFVDELWLFGKKPSAENILSEATGSLASRPEGFVIYATTQSDDQPAGVFLKKLNYFRGVRDGTIVDRRCLPLIYEYPEPMMKASAYLDPSTWYIPNPNLARGTPGLPPDPEWLASKLSKNQIEGQSSLQLFIAKHFNIQVGVGIKDGAWVGADYWESCGDPALTLDEIKKRCDIIVAGIDGGGLDDLLGLALLGRDKVTREWLLWGHAWAHRSVFERRKDIAPRLMDFAAAGDLTIVESVGDDVHDVADIIEELESAGLLPGKVAIGVDQAGISEIVDELGTRGIGAERIGGVPQGWKLTNAIKTAERKLAGGALKHGAQPIMAWNVGNAKVEARGNAIIITKQTAGSAKIDNLMALLDAIVAMGQNPDTGPSVYETHGIRIF